MYKKFWSHFKNTFLNMLNKYLKAVEWNLKNLDKLTPQDWLDFEQVEAQLHEWVNEQPEEARMPIEAQITGVIAALKIFKGSRFRGVF